jgi:dihydropteroate synthase
MGVLNVTPDSFSDGGLFFDTEAAIAQGQALAAAGADIIDVGGESTRPFSDAVPVEQEILRVTPVVKELARCLSIPISIDTSKAEVARQAIAVGASIANDVSGLRLDPAMASVVADSGVPVVVMHMKGTPKDMQADPVYADVVAEVRDFLADAVQRAEKAGIDRNKVIVDPGIGFGKTVRHNLLLIKNLSAFHALETPVLIGPSRKSFISKILGAGDEPREVGTQAAVAAAALQGVHIVRVHDVKRTQYTLNLIDAIRDAA